MQLIRTMVLLTAVPLIGGGAAARAQQPASAGDSTANDTSRVMKLAPVKISATMLPGARSDVGSGIPARISVITRDRIAGSRHGVLPEAMVSEPAVSYHDDLGQPTKLTLSARGFSAGPTIGLPAGLTVFLDGVRQNEPDEQEVNFDLLPLDEVQRVEFLSGNGTLLGPNSLGGAVNLITFDPTRSPGGSAEVSYGSWNSRSVDASTTQPAGSGALRFSGGYETADGWRVQTSARRYNGMAVARFGDDARGVRVQLFGVRARGETAGSLPESIFDRDPRVNFTPGDFDDLRLGQFSLTATDSVARGQASLTPYVRASSGERFNVNQAPDPNVRGRTRSTTFGLSADWRKTIAAAFGVTSFRIGFDVSASAVSVRIFNEPAATGVDELTTSVRSPTWDAAPYLITDVARGRMTLSAGARYDLVAVPFRDELRDTEDRNYFRRLSPRAGLNFDVGSGSSLYTSVGQTFRAPAILELGCASAAATCPLPFALAEDPPLKPVRSTSYEAGARMRFQQLLLSASAYLNNLYDEIFFVGSESSSLAGFFQNLDRTRRLGGEVDVRSNLGRYLTVNAAYALTRAEFRSDALLFSARSNGTAPVNELSGDNHVRPGALMPMVPKNQLKLGAGFTPTPQIISRIDVRWIGAQWLRGDEANQTKPLAAYSVSDASASYAIANWTLSASASNLFNTRAPIFGTFNINRQTNQLERFLTPLTARTVRLSLGREFGHHS